MFDAIIVYSVRNKLVIGLFTAALIVWGLWSLRQIPIDAIPDITNNQVQVITTSPSLATEEVEQMITVPVELALQNLQDLEEIRSISRFGLSVVTVVFKEAADLYLSRQLVSEHLKAAAEQIPPGLGTPEMAPISTGLGEIYQYIVRPAPGFEDKVSATELRSIQDWIIRRQLAGIEGVVEVNTLGGYLKQYEVAVDPNRLKALDVSLAQVFDALEASNENTGGAYIEKDPRTYYIRTDGRVDKLDDIAEIVVDVRQGHPVLVRDLAEVRFGQAPRYGATTADGREVVSGTVMMLRGANSAAVTERVKARIAEIRRSLPEGVEIEPYLVRDKLVDTAIRTVTNNLVEGGLIVVFILVLLLGNWRAGLVVASVIPLAMLFAVAMMNLLGISANLMSLGAIDFGLIVDGAVIIVEAIVHRLQVGFAGTRLSPKQMEEEVIGASINIRNSAAFGEIIILMVYLPILALVGIEGKMFRPMAQTVMLAIAGALILSLTYVPMMTALVLRRDISDKITLADRIVGFAERLYRPVLELAMRAKMAVVLTTVALFAVSIWTFSRMGGEFIPTLEEGDLALHQILPPGTSLSQSVEVSYLIQEKLKAAFPEVLHIVTKIGSAEIPTDPMPVETGDIIVVMKPKDEWTTATTRQGMQEAMARVMQTIPGVASEYSQPIQMRFNELMTGSRADIAVQLYGEDLAVLADQAEAADRIIRRLPGVGTVKVDQTDGMPQVLVEYDYDRLAQYGLQVRDVNRVIRTGFAGAAAGTVYEGDRRYPLTLRLQEDDRRVIEDVRNLYLTLESGAQVPISSVAKVEIVDGPAQINRDATRRRVVIGVNVGDTDVATLVERIQTALDAELDLPPGYYFRYGGQFENFEAASARLAIAVPVALALIFMLLFFTFGSIAQAALIFVAIPLSAIGGIWALELRGMPFSISAGIGFIALFGVAVLNGIVLIGYFNQLEREGWADVRARIIEGTRVRLRPVLLTASVASLGFLPMALSSSGGAEVQRPLATVVIGGLISATFLTLVVLPILYSWLARWQDARARRASRGETGFTEGTPVALTALVLFLVTTASSAQGGQTPFRENPLDSAPGAAPPMTLAEAIDRTLAQHPAALAAEQRFGAASALEDLAYRPGATTLSYDAEGQFRPNDNRLQAFGLTQNFSHPAVVRTQNALQAVRVGRFDLERAQTAQQLRYAVSELYYALQREEALRAVYAQAAERYAGYERVAEVRVRVGAANPLERLSLVAPLRVYRLEVARAERTAEGLAAQLAALTGAGEPVRAADTLALAALPRAARGDTLEIELARRLQREAQAEIGVLEAGLKPGFALGYTVQKFYELGPLSAFQAGVSLPLFRGPTEQRIAAQALSVEAAATAVAVQQREVAQRAVALTTEIETARLAVEAYAGLLDSLNPELARVTQLNYEAGQLGYLEVLSSLRLLVDNQVARINALHEHNVAVAQYQFLLNL